MEYPNDRGPEDEKPGGVFRMATLAAWATTWSGTTDVLSDPGRVHSGQPAGSPSGELVAVWASFSEGKAGVYSSVRAAPDAAWSQPVRLDEPAADAGFNGSPQLVHSARGTTTVAYVQGGAETGEVKVTDRAADGTWSKPVTVSRPGTYPTGPTLTIGSGGHAAPAWNSTDDPSSGTHTQVIAVRPADSPTWSAEEPANGFRTGAWRKVAIDPRGDVTLRASATGWPATSTVVPFGDKTVIGGGWQTYNTVVGAGDLDDGIGDLLARDTTGVLWRYYGTGKGKLSARAQVGDGWQMWSRG